MRVFSPPILNLCLRGLTLGTRFLFIFALAKFLSPAEVGLYGLFTAAVGYALYFVGMDFYVYTTREILKADNSDRGRILKAQVFLSLGLYVVFVPIFVMGISFLDWPWILFVGFVPILFFEHLNQELYRILVAMSRQLAASFVLFIRQGSWALAFLAVTFWSEELRSIEVIIVLWGIAGLVAALLGLSIVHQMRFGGWNRPVDWAWTRKGLKISAIFLIATLALRAVNTADRYLIEYFSTLEAVGAYVLFFAIASTLMTFMDAAVFAFAYPRLIQLYQSGQKLEAQAQVRRLWGRAIIATVVFAVMSWLALPILLDWIDRLVYRDYLYLYPWIFAGTTVYMFSMIPHYVLYAQNIDRPIVVSHIAAFFVFIIATSVLHSTLGLLAVPVAVLLAFVTIFVWKMVAYRNNLI